MNKVIGFLLLALPGVASFAAYGMAQEKGMRPITSAALAGAAFAATEIASTILASGNVSGLTLERMGALALNPQPKTWGALTASQRGNLGYLVPQSVGACYGTC
jgi:hypothetical protein